MHVIRQLLRAKRIRLANSFFSERNCSTSLVPLSEIVEKRNFLFAQEQKRQLEEVGRVEQIAVEVSGPPEDVVLMMNQNISTPYDCCKHISLPLCERSPLALIDDKILWDMHRPLPGNCRIKFLSFKDKDPYSLNETFWRTGSFILGAVIAKAFKEDAHVKLYSFPDSRVNTGSFFYDVDMKVKGWQATTDELKILSGEFFSLVFKKLKIERLSVKKSFALKLFEDNPYKAKDISKNAKDSGDNLVTLYKVGDHIDISNGPMIGNTSFFGRVTVTAAHYIGFGPLERYRFQGVALPKGILLNTYAYGVLVRRGAILNEFPLPDLPNELQVYSDGCLTNSKVPIDGNPMNVQY